MAMPFERDAEVLARLESSIAPEVIDIRAFKNADLVLSQH